MTVTKELSRKQSSLEHNYIVNTCYDTRAHTHTPPHSLLQSWDMVCLVGNMKATQGCTEYYGKASWTNLVPVGQRCVFKILGKGKTQQKRRPTWPSRSSLATWPCWDQLGPSWSRRVCPTVLRALMSNNDSFPATWMCLSFLLKCVDHLACASKHHCITASS